MVMHFRAAALTAAYCVVFATSALADVFQVVDNKQFLDIKGDTGKVITAPDIVEWQVTPHEKYYTIQFSVGKYAGWYLDIDGKNGKLMLSKQLFEGCKWDLRRAGPPDTGRFVLVNVGKSRYQYQEVDFKTLRLSRKSQQREVIWRE